MSEVVYALQWQDPTEPWGWETWTVLVDEAAARAALCEYVRERNKFMHERQLEDWLDTVRVVSLPVLTEPPSPSFIGDEPPGVEVVLTGAQAYAEVCR